MSVNQSTECKSNRTYVRFAVLAEGYLLHKPVNKVEGINHN